MSGPAHDGIEPAPDPLPASTACSRHPSSCFSASACTASGRASARRWQAALAGQGQPGGDADRGRASRSATSCRRFGRRRPRRRGEPADRADGRSVAAAWRGGRARGDAGVGHAGGPQRAGAEGDRVGRGAARAGGPGAVRLARFREALAQRRGGAVRGRRGALRGGVGARLQARLPAPARRDRVARAPAR